jgi:hypothetical protein
MGEALSYVEGQEWPQQAKYSLRFDAADASKLGAWLSAEPPRVRNDALLAALTVQTSLAALSRAGGGELYIAGGVLMRPAVRTTPLPTTQVLVVLNRTPDTSSPLNSLTSARSASGVPQTSKDALSYLLAPKAAQLKEELLSGVSRLIITAKQTKLRDDWLRSHAPQTAHQPTPLSYPGSYVHVIVPQMKI